MGKAADLLAGQAGFGLAQAHVAARSTATDEMLSGSGCEEGFAVGRDDQTESGAVQFQCKSVQSAALFIRKLVGRSRCDRAMVARLKDIVEEAWTVGRNYFEGAARSSRYEGGAYKTTQSRVAGVSPST